MCIRQHRIWRTRPGGYRAQRHHRLVQRIVRVRSPWLASLSCHLTEAESRGMASCGTARNHDLRERDVKPSRMCASISSTSQSRHNIRKSVALTSSTADLFRELPELPRYPPPGIKRRRRPYSFRDGVNTTSHAHHFVQRGGPRSAKDAPIFLNGDALRLTKSQSRQHVRPHDIRTQRAPATMSTARSVCSRCLADSTRCLVSRQAFEKAV